VESPISGGASVHSVSMNRSPVEPPQRSRTGPDAALANADRDRASRTRARDSLLTLLAVVVLTGVAFWIRLDGLQGWDGTLTVDEARLAMAARGVLESGLPRLPSGWIYTRGLLATYLTAPSFALLGETDFAARLPAVLAGTALIPLAYLLGREVAGRLGGLFVAAILVGHASFVIWSRAAWFYALFVTLFCAALLFILRAHRTHRARDQRDQLLAGLLVGLSAYAHEVGIFLLLPLAAQVALRLWSVRTDRARWRTTLLAPIASLLIVGLAAIILWLLVTRLRAESLVGAYGEIEEYLSPAVEWSRIRFYLRMLLDGPGLLLAGAVAGVGFGIWQRQASTLLLWLALLPAFGHAAFLIPRGPQERYGLTMVLVIVVLGAQGMRQVTELAYSLFVTRSTRLGKIVIPASAVVGAVLIGTFLAHQDVGRAVERAALSPREGAWLRQARMLGINPDDIVMTDIPTSVGWYIGGLDYWVSSHEYEKYTTFSGEVRRDVHTGAILVRSRGEFERLVARPLAGRQVWVIVSGRNYQWGELVDDDLKALIDRSASQRVNPGDNTRILLVNLPSGS
jgi:4-amino-4-deoxy-L-arabinose transferase-like glycosyltransferase